MKNTATLAVAGARKTQSIVEACAGGDTATRRLVLTYTLSGQLDLEERLRAACPPAGVPEVCGWYAFLLRHWVRPFLPLRYSGRRLGGLNFDGVPQRNSKGIVIASGEDRFLDGDSRAYKRFLSKLAIDVADAADGTVITRLQRMYDEIYVDEIQDMTGYDLDILERLLRSTSVIRMVGDMRQSVFSTNAQDPRHKKYRGLGMLDWFEVQRKAERLEVDYSSTTWRSVQAVATFSDSIFDPALKFPATESAQDKASEHDGVFALAPENAAAYIEQYQPFRLRQTIATALPQDITATNFGISKGQTHDRVLIFTTKPMRDFLTKGTRLAGESACGLYVGVTRAIYSVAFVMPEPDASYLTVWTPTG
jgi:DNA helicase-2/ATP-dependent DNA helicase PcrA